MTYKLGFSEGCLEALQTIHADLLAVTNNEQLLEIKLKHDSKMNESMLNAINSHEITYGSDQEIARLEGIFNTYQWATACYKFTNDQIDKMAMIEMIDLFIDSQLKLIKQEMRELQ